ncbi:MAG: hypothetical protein CME45_07495 [Halieaceae bacterium]|nr:hypothetical protein [Halieaceae bacterium]|tara:strand:- start:322 stop:720 length:399 start_codon:yes stop_codon:yes gene_type:complete
MSEMEMWNLLAVFMVGNATWFLAYIVAIWLGFRMTNNIYTSEDTPIAGKILVSVYCLTVSIFMTLLTLNTNDLFRDIASGLQSVGEAQELSTTAQSFITEAGSVLIINPIQAAFIASIIIMQLLQIWRKKPS